MDRNSSAYYDIRCSWSVVDHHAVDKENETDLARSSHWFLHLGKDIWLIFCSSLCDTCSCQSLWQGRHLLVPSYIHFTIWIHGRRWLLSHILWQMLWRMRGGRAGRAGAGQVGQTLIKLHSGRRSRAPTGELTVAFGHGHPLVLYINSLRACVCDTTVPHFNPPTEPARTVGRTDGHTDFLRENRPGQTASV
jgi:hypothetical protein